MDGDGSGTFNNTGALEKIAGSTGETIIQSVAFNNAGSVVCRAGILRFSATFRQTGGRLWVSGGRIILDLAAAISGGTVQGHSVLSDFVAALNNDGGTISPGDAPGESASAGDATGPPDESGLFTLTGSYEQGPGGGLDIQLGGGLLRSHQGQAA